MESAEWPLMCHTLGTRPAYSKVMRHHQMAGPGVYIIWDEVTAHIYIGSAKCMARRWAEHISQLRRGRHHNQRLQGAWHRGGPETLQCHILERVENSQQLVSVEQYWIDELNPQLNVLRVAGKARGYKHTDAAREKIHSAATGRRHSLETKQLLAHLQRGKTLSPETRAKMSQSRKGHPTSESTREKLRMGRLGKKHSPETIHLLRELGRQKSISEATREKIRQSLRGRPTSLETRQKLASANRGKKHTVEAKHKMAVSAKARWPNRGREDV